MRPAGGAVGDVRRIVAVGAAVLCAAALVAAIVVLQVQGRRQAEARSQALACSPAPCADAGGYRVHVDRAWTSARLVHVQVSLTVPGGQRMHAEPDDFSLDAPGGGHEKPRFDASAGCPAWPRTDIPAGGRLGPRTLCFPAPRGGGRPTLHWDPDTGISEYFSAGYDIAL
jgi:hypothetical protein